MLSLAATARLPPPGGLSGAPKGRGASSQLWPGPGVLLGLPHMSPGLSITPRGSCSPGNQKSHSTNNNFLKAWRTGGRAGSGQAAPNRPHFLLNSPLEHGDFQED